MTSSFMQKPSSTGLLEFYEAQRQHLLTACTACGKCFEVCPMVPFLELQGAEPAAVVSGVRAVLSRQFPDAGGAAESDALQFIGACSGSQQCVPACPVGINPELMLRIAKITAHGGLGDAVLMNGKDDPNWFPRIRAYAKVQLTEEEQEKWM